MRTLLLSLLAVVIFLFALRAVPALAAEDRSPSAAVGDMAQAAKIFLSSLTEEQKAQAVFDMKDDERLNWHFIPKERKGITFGDLTPAQRHLGHALIGASLSSRGAWKTNTIMSLEAILRELENDNGQRRNPEKYHFSLFGQIGPDTTWGWRLEGHHLSLNFTLLDGQLISTTPLFMGTNPAEVRQGPLQGLRVLSVEEDLGFELVNSLDEEQKKQAIVNETAPADVLTEAQRRVKPLESTGLPFSKMNEEQKRTLMGIVREYVFRVRTDVAREDLQKIRDAGTDNLLFAWAGATQPGTGHYYRIQGPTFLLEFDNTQNNANHIHTVWRDFEADFGEDLLAEHYKTSHSGQ